MGKEQLAVPTLKAMSRDSFTFDVTVHNLSSEAKEFTSTTVVNTDHGKWTYYLEDAPTTDQEGENHSCTAMGSVTVPIVV